MPRIISPFVMDRSGLQAVRRPPAAAKVGGKDSKGKPLKPAPVRPPRPPTAYRYECARCEAKGDHPILCGKCGARAIRPNPAFDEKVAAQFVFATGTAAGHGQVQMKSMLEVLESAKDLPFETTQMPFLDHILGGGVVRGKSVLIAGGPGAGKSTLLMQLLITFARPDRRVLYISGEEEEEQIANRAMRFTGGKGIPGIMDAAPYMDLVSDRRAGAAAGAIRTVAPALVIVDSIQEIGDEELEANFGGHKQVDNTMRLCITEAKKVNAAIFFVCHVTKQLDPAGPKRAEHLVDAMLQLEHLDVEEAFEMIMEQKGLSDDEDDDDEVMKLQRKFKPEDEYRRLWSSKNRFAPANRQSIMKMTNKGLIGT